MDRPEIGGLLEAGHEIGERDLGGLLIVEDQALHLDAFSPVRFQMGETNRGGGDRAESLQGSKPAGVICQRLFIHAQAGEGGGAHHFPPADLFSHGAQPLEDGLLFGKRLACVTRPYELDPRPGQDPEDEGDGHRPQTGVDCFILGAVLELAREQIDLPRLVEQTGRGRQGGRDKPILPGREHGAQIHLLHGDSRCCAEGRLGLL